jgi:ATP/maltotriose-dependent transcriptional regulator MalT
VKRRRAPAARPAHGRDTGATPTPPTPATKYRPSVPTRSLVARHRLTDVLRAAARRRLILIHAPSGYGKSTLAAQWREELSREGVAVAWLTVDDDDNNAVWFLAHLLESIRQVRPMLAESLGQVLEDHGDDAARYVLALIDEIHENDDPITLVVDDWHRVSDSQTTAALAFLLDHGCHHLQIIVTSWSATGLPSSRLRIADELVEIDSDTLRFDAEEARLMLNDVSGLQLSGGDVAALTAATDGWAAGLQLVALSLRGGADATSRLSGATDVVGEFLAENVLDTLEPEIADFVLATSITERTSGSLASALAQVTRGQAMLEDVAQRGPVPAADRQRSELVSLPPDVRRVPAPPTRARRSRTGRTAAPRCVGVVRRTRLPE